MGQHSSKPKPFRIEQREAPYHGHIITVMMENRSFDQILGYLYTEHEMKTNSRVRNFDGAEGKTFTNKIPQYYREQKGIDTPSELIFEKGLNLDKQPPNPGETFAHVMTQLYGKTIPESNRFKVDNEMDPPLNQPPNADEIEPEMSGFVEDYINVYHCTKHGENANLESLPDLDDVKVIFQGCDPKEIPVTSTLARSFAICDRWFSR
mmetsp:Transcript_92/g.347  ORF Transcript_92/g.347 Transcript_92/m.347 type:complete len:207 (-) Transcript_92:2081-2701(-)